MTFSFKYCQVFKLLSCINVMTLVNAIRVELSVNFVVNVMKATITTDANVAAMKIVTCCGRLSHLRRSSGGSVLIISFS